MNLKQMVGISAAQEVTNGMVVGLGTGSTAFYMVEEIARRINEEGLSITGVTTSNATEKQATALGIPLKSIDDVTHVDLTIDGADEISSDFQGTKGGGAALLFEKIVASYSKRNIWIVDESKLVSNLGAFPLPVEVIPYGSEQLLNLFKKKNYQPSLRMIDDTILITDSGNYIIDLHLNELKTADVKPLATWLNSLPGVVEHGLFIDVVDTVIVGRSTGPETIQVKR